MPSRTPGDRREDHAQHAADLIAGRYGDAELVIIAAVASLAVKVAKGQVTPQAATRDLRRTIAAVMAGTVPAVTALLAALFAETIRQALAVHGHQAAPEPAAAQSREWKLPFTPRADNDPVYTLGPSQRTEVKRSPMRQWQPPFAQAPRETAEWEQLLAGQLNRAVDHAEFVAVERLQQAVKAIEAADAEPPNPFEAALNRAFEQHGGWPGSTLSARRIRAAQSVLDDLAQRGITGFTDRKGRRWDLATYVEMATRTAVSNAWDDMQAKAAARAGIDLADVGTYSQEGSCPRCLPWLGRTISLAGITPGYPTLEQAKAEGFRHPNCRCFWTPRGLQVTPEVTSPVSPAEAAAAYAASQKQRALERTVRAAGREAQAAVTAQARSRARRRLATAKAASAQHRQAHGVIMTKVGVQRRERPFGAR